MSAEQLIVLALLAAAFAAGWFARGMAQDDEPEDAAEVPGPVAPTNGRVTPERAREALARAIDAWLDDDGEPSSAGLNAVAALEEQADALRAARLEPQAAAADDARDVLEAYLMGRPMDAAASRRLDEAERALG